MGAATGAAGTAAATVAAAANEARAGHIVLCGRDNLGLRTLEELHRLGDEVVILAGTPGDALGAAAQSLDADLMHGNYRDESCLRSASSVEARAIVLAENDAVGNLHVALIAQNLNPRLRIVARSCAVARRTSSATVPCSIRPLSPPPAFSRPRCT